MNYWVLIILIFTLFSCSNKKTTDKKNSGEIEQVKNKPKNDYKKPPLYIDSASTEQEVLAHLDKRKPEIEEILRNSKPEQADSLYINYFKENDSVVTILNLRKLSLLDKFTNFFQYDEKTDQNHLVVPKEYQQEIKNIEKRGVEFWYIGEGYTELRMNPDYYYKMFSGKLTADFQRWLDFTTKEDKELYAADAGIIVPWKDVADRILVREKFIKDFPNSRLVTEQIKPELNYYRWDYFVGEENTPVFSDYSDENNPKMDTEILNEYQRFMKSNPDSETTKMLKQLLKVPKKKIWSNNVLKMLGERVYLPGIFTK